MRGWWRIVLVALVVSAGCSDGEEDPGATAPMSAEPVTRFTWTTTLDQAGYGYVLTVDGVVGDAFAEYSMHVDPLVTEGGDEGADVVAALAAAAVNGYAEAGQGLATSEGDVATDGGTDVVVLDHERWYRSPWLLGEASRAMDGAEWVHVAGADAVLAGVATPVLNERYDQALRRLLQRVADGAPIDAPSPDELSSELDETLTPWIGLVGEMFPIGASATARGGPEGGEVAWRHVSTQETEGVDAVMAGTVRWRSATAPPPTAPSSAVDVAEVTAQLGG